jgi:hypothetical protein
MRGLAFPQEVRMQIAKDQRGKGGRTSPRSALVLLGVVIGASCAETQPVPATAPQTAVTQTAAKDDTACGSVPAPSRRYLKAKTTLPRVDLADQYIFPREFETPLGIGVTLSFPANTSVDVVRILGNNQIAMENPPKEVLCVFAMVKIVDAGGSVPPGKLYAARLSDLSDAPVGPPPADQAKADRDAKVSAAKAMGEEEERTGRCSEESVGELEHKVAFLKSFLDSRKSGDHPEIWDLVAHKLVVAKEEGTPLTLNAGAGGEHHVVAISYFSKTHLEMLDAQGYRIAVISPYAAIFEGVRLRVDTRVLQANARETLKIKVVGRGCTAVAVFRRFF